MNDSYIDALNYAIKEEIADHYFHDRKVIDEELAELSSFRAAVAEQARETGVLLADLAALLISSEIWVDFWGLVKVKPPSLKTLPSPDKVMWQEIGLGLGWKNRYKGRVKRQALKVADRAREYLQAHQELVSLVAEVNDDIVRFNQNHDFLMLRSVLCEMNPDLVSKKHWLGNPLDGEACLDLGEAMSFRAQPQADPLFWPLDQVPPDKDLSRAVSRITFRILKEYNREVRSRAGGD